MSSWLSNFESSHVSLNAEWRFQNLNPKNGYQSGSILRYSCFAAEWVGPVWPFIKTEWLMLMLMLMTRFVHAAAGLTTQLEAMSWFIEVVSTRTIRSKKSSSERISHPQLRFSNLYLRFNPQCVQNLQVWNFEKTIGEKIINNDEINCNLSLYLSLLWIIR